MICPKCGALSPEESRFCCNCATVFPAAEPENPEAESTEEAIIVPEIQKVSEIPDAPTEEVLLEPESAPLPKKGRLWVPIVILAVMFAAGLTLFLISQKKQPVSDPNMPWFSILDGQLYFDESKYTGSSELEIPEIVAGQTVTAISAGCFADCDELTIVFLPDTVQTIGDSAFQDCGALRGLFLPESVTGIGSQAFYGCTSMESVCIPYSVKSIGAAAFWGCSSLHYIFYSGPAESWRQLYTGPISQETYIFAKDETVKHGNFAP